MSGFEDDEVTRATGFSLVAHSQNDVLSLGGGSTEGMERDWSMREESDTGRTNACGARVDSIWNGQHERCWEEADAERRRPTGAVNKGKWGGGAAEHWDVQTETSSGEGSIGSGAHENTLGGTCPGSVGHGTECGGQDSVSGRQNCNAGPDACFTLPAGGCDRESRCGAGAESSQASEAASVECGHSRERSIPHNCHVVSAKYRGKLFEGVVAAKIVIDGQALFNVDYSDGGKEESVQLENLRAWGEGLPTELCS